jgi:hypothetical protein
VSPPAPLPDRGGGREQRSRRRTEPIEFFIDRSLGRKHLADALHELGYTAHTMASVYASVRHKSSRTNSGSPTSASMAGSS